MANESISWIEAEPSRFSRELSRMKSTAPDLEWDGTSWNGPAPEWPFERERPVGLDAFLNGRRLLVRVQYSPAFPMVAPKVIPIDPEPDPMVRTQHDWHVNGDGSLCLLQTAEDWDGTGTASELVVKASGWFVEYLLMDAGLIERMTTDGIVDDDCFDPLFSSALDR